MISKFHLPSGREVEIDTQPMINGDGKVVKLVTEDLTEEEFNEAMEMIPKLFIIGDSKLGEGHVLG